ncbi:RNA polymerase sigma factor [Tenacibaculum amylolyticum]|uniref:RNA polymerase sigma factor n=1 Tax=Tenacibaculum amylolyticum TaxID=104269 RepID=UPI003895660B
MKQNKNQNFETIYRQYHPMVLQMCLGFVKGDKDTANDLAQEVFISVWKNLAKFRADASYKTWIYRITVNTCLQYVKKDSKVTKVSATALESETNEAAETTNENIQNLYEAIGKLEKLDRLIIMMVLENQDYDSIAEVIGIKPTNLRVKIHRIKKRLEKILKNS